MRKLLSLYLVTCALLFAAWQCFAQLPLTHGGPGAPAASAGCGSGFPSISGLVARYIACTGVTTSGGNVTQVADQSAASNANVTNLSGTVPFSASSSYNSNNAFAFNGSGLLGSTSFKMAATSQAVVCMPILFTSTASAFVGDMTLTNATFAGTALYLSQSNPGTSLALQGVTAVTVAASTKYRLCAVGSGSGSGCTGGGTNDGELWLGTGAGVGNAMTCQQAANFISYSFTNGSTNNFVFGGQVVSGPTYQNESSIVVPEIDVWSGVQLTTGNFGSIDAYYQSNYGS